jgi:hypothetical protein
LVLRITAPHYRLRKNPLLGLILGGAAVYRCDNYSLLKNSKFRRFWEGHEFHSCRKCRKISAGFSRWGDTPAEKTFFPQPL